MKEKGVQDRKGGLQSPLVTLEHDSSGIYQIYKSPKQRPNPKACGGYKSIGIGL